MCAFAQIREETRRRPFHLRLELGLQCRMYRLNWFIGETLSIPILCAMLRTKVKADERNCKLKNKRVGKRTKSIFNGDEQKHPFREETKVICQNGSVLNGIRIE